MDIPLSQQSIGGSQSTPVPAIVRPTYLPATCLPRELHEQVKIYLEERLYSPALSLLQQVLAAGVSQSSSIPVPSYNILAMLATIAVHPILAVDYTTMLAKGTANEKLEAANLSLHYLAHLNLIVGPVNADFRRAFKFVSMRRAGGGRRSLANRRETLNNQAQDASDSEDEVKGIFAKEASIWANAQDFWHIVGWAFNCSVKHTKRWIRWRLWLELILEILEDDLEQHSALSNDTDGVQSSDQFLLDQFIGGREATKNGGLKRMMRAIFAEGTDRDINEFGEVFVDETKVKEAKKDASVATKTIDVAAGDFGDYADGGDEEDALAAASREVKRAKNTPGSRNASGAHELKHNTARDQDDPEAASLRQRLVILLSKFALKRSDLFTTHDILIDTYEQYMRPLPLNRLVNLIAVTSPSDTNPCFEPSSHIALMQVLVRPLLAGSGAPQVTSYFVTQEILQTSYLPYSATQGSTNNIIVDNAKVSLCLENMLRLLNTHVGLTKLGGALRSAVEKGIKKRRAAIEVASGHRKKHTDVEVDALQWLTGSEARLKMVVALVDMKT